MRARAVVAVLLIAGVLLTGCTADSIDDPKPEPPQPSMTAQPLESAQATLSIRNGGATVESAAGRAEGASGDLLADSQVITTAGPDAIVELTWSDGAVTRLGPETSFTVGSPVSPGGARGRQQGGLSWNRLPPAPVDDLSAPVAPYVVLLDDADPVFDQGEVVLIDCRSAACRVTGSAETETQDCASAPGLDTWVEENIALDELAGFIPVSAVGPFADADGASTC